MKKQMSKIKYLQIFNILLSCLLLSACGNKTENISISTQRHMERSIAYEEQGQYKAAVIEARNIIDLDKRKISGYERLAELFLALGNAKEAAALLIPFNKYFNSSTYLLLAKSFNEQSKFLSANKSLNTYIDTGGDRSNTNYLIALATTLSGGSKLEQSVEILEEVVAKNPADIDAKIVLAKIYLNNDFHREGKELIAQTLKQFPKNPHVLYLAAQIAYTDGNLDSAEDLLSQSLMNLRSTDILTPLRSSVLDQLATVLTARHRTFEAITYRKILAEASPGVVEAKAKFDSAIRLLNTGNIGDAEILFKELYKAYPNTDINALYLGMINYQEGDLESANRLFSSHLDTEIAPTILVQHAAVSNLKLNQSAEAIILLEKALLTHPNNASLLRLYGLAALQNQETEEDGLLALHKSIALKPEQNALRLTLASYYFSKGKQEQGFAQIDLIFKKEPGNIQATALYVQAMLKNGRTEEASKAINNLLQLNPQNPEALNLAARYELINSEFESAEKLYLKTIEHDPDNIDALNALAAIAIKNGQYTRSVGYYEKMITINPNSPHAYKGLVAVLEIDNQADQAIESLKAYTLETSPNDQRYTASAVTAEYYLRKDDLDKAEIYRSTAISAENQTEYIVTISSLLDYAYAQKAFQDKDWDKARALLIKSSNGNIPQQKIISSLIQIELKIGQPQEVERLIYILEDQYPNEITTLLARASIYDAKGEKKTADAFLKVKWGNKLTPMLGKIIYNRLQSEPAEQSRFLSQWHNAEPENYKPLTYLALKAQQNNDKYQAIIYYEKALQLKTDSPSLLNNLAWLYYEVKNPLAQDTAHRAYELAPGNAAILDTYGWILVVNGHKDKGMRFLEKALKTATPSELKEIEGHLKAAEKI